MENFQENTLIFTGEYWRGSFMAMASPCEVLIDTDDESQAKKIYHIVKTEALRIENKFSRYRNDNIIYQINNANGQSVKVDTETANLLNYADQCYKLSEGLFDITSGVLRQAWKFDGSDNIPNQETINKLLPLIGWNKISWNNPYLTINKKMQIDFGGIGKEYAVDRAALLIKNENLNSTLINFGGDIYALGPRRNNLPWHISVIDPLSNQTSNKKKNQKNKQPRIELKKGAIATSGDLNRFLLKENIRYSHILNPKTGWPILDAPRQISVLAPSCLEAGMLSSFACLQGGNAAQYLESQNIDFHIEV